MKWSNPWIYHVPALMDRHVIQSVDRTMFFLLILRPDDQFEQVFQPYTQYCLEHSRCLQYAKEKNKENELFKAYIVWCETQKDCERLRLMDLLVEPMQRLTKYSLLLKRILKNSESDHEISALKKMNESVGNFVLGVDATLRKRHEQDRLAWIASRIEAYDVVDINFGEEVEKVSHFTSRFSLSFLELSSRSQPADVGDSLPNTLLGSPSSSTYSCDSAEVHMIPSPFISFDPFILGSLILSSTGWWCVLITDLLLVNLSYYCNCNERWQRITANWIFWLSRCWSARVTRWGNCWWRHPT